WLLFKKWYSRDTKNAIEYLNREELPPPCYYIVEEAHNFLKIPIFKELFDVVTREARKFHIYFIFLTQKIPDIDKTIYGSLATKIFLFKEKDRSSVKAHIEDYRDELFNEDELEVFANVKKHMFLLMHDNGTSGMKFQLTEEE